MATIPLDGGTELIGVLGHPVAQVRICGPLTELLRARGRNAVVVPMAVAPEGLHAALAGLRGIGNLLGLIATVPHKPAVLSAAASATERARKAGGANAIRPAPGGGWEADMFDGEGFAAGLRATGFDPAGRSALVVGAGGAGGAVAAALFDAGMREVAIHDVDPARADALAARLRGFGHSAHAVPAPAPGGRDLAVNATPLGMRPEDPLPIPAEALRPPLRIADVVMKPDVTPLLAAAEAAGCPIHHGRLVMQHQLGPLADFFLRS